MPYPRLEARATVVRRPSQDANQTSDMPRHPRRARGVSLIELLIVVTILLVVLTIAIPRLMAARQSAREASAVVFLRNLHAAQEQFYIVHGSYAATFAELDGFLASNHRGLAPLRRFPKDILPAHIEDMPTLAFLLLPAPGMPDDQAFVSDGPQLPSGTDQQSGGGGAPPLGNSPAAGNSNPPGGGSGGDSSGSGPASGGGTDGDAAGGQGGSSSDGGGSGSQGGAWSKADRITYQGYQFHLLRPTAHNWNCLAVPMHNERNANHYFADQTGAVRREFGRPASPHSPLL